MAITTVTASTLTNRSSTAYALMDSMTLTPGAGTYLAVATFETEMSALATEDLDACLFANAVEQTHTTRTITGEPSFDPSVYWTVTCHAVVTVGASETIQLHWRSASGSQINAYRRTLTLVPVLSANVTQLTGTTEDTVTTTDYSETVASMTSTPAAGKYLLLFTSHARHSTGDASGRFKVYVGGSEVGTHTLRDIFFDTSFVEPEVTHWPVAIFTVVDVNGSQAVDIRAAVDTGTLTIGERTLTLIKVDAADVYEVTSSTATADSSQSDELVDGMTLSPAANDYLALFSGYGGIAHGDVANATATMSFYVNGSQVTNSELRKTYSGSIDTNDDDIWAGPTGKITVGASQDAEVYWRGDTTDTRALRARSFVLFRESVVTPPDLEGFRFFDDVATEGGTPLANQDTNYNASTGEEVFLRVLLNEPLATGTYKLQIAEDTSSDWYKVTVP